MKKSLLAVLFLAAAPAYAEQVVRFYGYAYDLDSNQYLYTEVHAQKIEDDHWLGGTIAYFAPDGKELGRKTLDFRADPYVPLYRLDLKYEGYVEGITAVGSNTIKMIKQVGPGRPLETERIERKDPVAADSGFHSFIRSRFAELMAGQTVRFNFAVAGNLTSFKFRAKRIADTWFEGKPAVRFRVEPDSLLRFVADPLELTYEPDSRKLLEYRGISNVHDPYTGKAYNARIAYYSAPPADVPKLPPLN